MGETVEAFQPLCNGAVRVEMRSEKLTAGAGCLLLREAMDRIGLIDLLATRLEDRRDQSRIQYSLQTLLRAQLMMIGP